MPEAGAARLLGAPHHPECGHSPASWCPLTPLLLKAWEAETAEPQPLALMHSALACLIGTPTLSTESTAKPLAARAMAQTVMMAVHENPSFTRDLSRDCASQSPAVTLLEGSVLTPAPHNAVAPLCAEPSSLQRSA